MFWNLVNPGYGPIALNEGGSGEYAYVNAEAAALVARFTTPPTNARAALIDALVGALVVGGVWAKLDCLYVMAQYDSQSARQNWIQDAYNLTAVSSPVFTTDRGYATDGVASYLDSGFNPVTAVSPFFTQNNASMGLYSRTSGQSTSSVAGWFDGTDGVTMLPRSAADLFQGRINQAASTSYTANTDGTGLYVLSRSASNATAAYRNGVAWGTGAAASAALNSATFTFGHVTAATFAAMQFSAGSIGASLSGAENTAFYDALLTYLQAVGAA